LIKLSTLRSEGLHVVSNNCALTGDVICNDFNASVDIDWECYTALEAMGKFVMVGVYKDAKLVGYMGIICSKFMHYVKKSVYVVDCIFIDEKHRSFKLLKRLIRFVEMNILKDKNAVLTITSKTQYPIDNLLKYIGFEAKETIYYKEF